MHSPSPWLSAMPKVTPGKSVSKLRLSIPFAAWNHHRATRSFPKKSFKNRLSIQLLCKMTDDCYTHTYTTCKAPLSRHLTATYTHAHLLNRPCLGTWLLHTHTHTHTTFKAPLSRHSTAPRRTGKVRVCVWEREREKERERESMKAREWRERSREREGGEREAPSERKRGKEGEIERAREREREGSLNLCIEPKT